MSYRPAATWALEARGPANRPRFKGRSRARRWNPCSGRWRSAAACCVDLPIFIQYQKVTILLGKVEDGEEPGGLY